MTTKEQMYMNCLMIEAFVKSVVINGTTDNATLVSMVDEQFHPETNEEMEAYSEAIIYAKYSVLN
jgi:hypothetical protein